LSGVPHGLLARWRARRTLYAPLTAAFLCVAVSALAFRARRGYRPFGLGLVASAVVLLGKFALDSGDVRGDRSKLTMFTRLPASSDHQRGLHMAPTPNSTAAARVARRAAASREG
jgi:hypothetical protein